MSTLRLFINDSNLPLSSLSEVEWRVQEGTTYRRKRGLITDLPTARRVEVFLPPSLALRSTITLPVGAKRQAGKILVHALDTVLIGDPAAQHLAYTLDGDNCKVTAVEKSVLDNILNTLAERKIRPHAVYIADALIPNDGNTLLWYGNGWARRLADSGQWFDAMSPAECPALLKQVLTKTDHINLAIPSKQASELSLTRWHAALGIDVLMGPGDPYTAPVASDAVNLLQGEFATGLHLDIDFQRLKPVVNLAAASFVLLVLCWFAQWMAWRHEERNLKHSMEAAYAAAFPNEPQIGSDLLAERLSKKLQSGNTPDANDALSNLAKAAEQLRAPNGTHLLSLELRGNRIDAEYQAKPEQILPLVQAISNLGKAESHPSGADHVSLSVTLHP